MEYIERTFSYLTRNVKNHVEKLFTKASQTPAFARFPPPTLTIISPDCGPSGSILDIDHTQDGKDHIPILTWSLPTSIPASEIGEYLVIVQDADAPLPTPILHAAYYGIPARKMELKQEDLVKDREAKNLLKGGSDMERFFGEPSIVGRNL